jgi:hypothetical protein
MVDITLLKSNLKKATKESIISRIPDIIPNWNKNKLLESRNESIPMETTRRKTKSNNSKNNK